MLKVALVGAGAISSVHRTAYCRMDDVKLTAVADINREAAEKAAIQHGIKAYLSLEELLNNETPDMVDICTPTYTHAELAIQALNRGIHVLCEKPMSLEESSAAKMLEAAKRNCKFLMIAHVIRFWPEYSYLKKIYEEGTYGRLLEAHFKRTGQSPSWGCWFSDLKKSGLSPIDLHIHDTDFILHMLGQPKAVSSAGFPENPSSNYLTTRYLYDSMVIEAEGGWFDAPIPFEMTFRAVFEDAVVCYTGGRLMLYPRAGQPQEVKTGERLMQETGINVGTTDAYFNEIKYFTECIRTGTYPEVSSPESSLASLTAVRREIESAIRGIPAEL